MAADDIVITTQNTAVTVQVLANDSDPDPGDRIRVSAIAAPPANGAAVMDSGNQTITYTPSSGFAGDATFRYRIADRAGLTASANVTVTVAASTPLQPFGCPIRVGDRDEPRPVVHAPLAAWPGETITLNGSRSYDVMGCPIAHHWKRIAGPAVTLTTPDQPTTTFLVPADATDGTQFRFRLRVSHDDHSPLYADAIVTITVRVPGPELHQSREDLLNDYASRTAGLTSACAAWKSLSESARDVFIWNTHRLYTTNMLTDVGALYAVYGQRAPDNCGDLGYNRTYMGASATLAQQMLQSWRDAGNGLRDWKRTGDLACLLAEQPGVPPCPHPPYQYQIDTHAGFPRAQINFFGDNVLVRRTYYRRPQPSDWCSPYEESWAPSGTVCSAGTFCQRSVEFLDDPCPYYADEIRSDPAIHAHHVGPEDDDRPEFARTSILDPYAFEMDQDFGSSHYSAPACGIDGEPTEMGYRGVYSATHGRPLWDWWPPNCSEDGFTPVSTGITNMRTVHVQELRDRIDARRRSVGLVSFHWTDTALIAGVTAVRAVHLRELRTALNETYVAAGRTVPVYTDPVIVALRTEIKALHLTELHAAVAALEE